MTLICMHLARASHRSFALIEESCLPRRHIDYLKCVNFSLPSFFLLLRWLSFVRIFSSQFALVGGIERECGQLTVSNQIYKMLCHRERNTCLIHLIVNHIRNISNIDYASRDQASLLIDIDRKWDNDNPYRSKKICFLWRRDNERYENRWKILPE